MCTLSPARSRSAGSHCVHILQDDLPTHQHQNRNFQHARPCAATLFGSYLRSPPQAMLLVRSWMNELQAACKNCTLPTAKCELVSAASVAPGLKRLCSRLCWVRLGVQMLPVRHGPRTPASIHRHDLNEDWAASVVFTFLDKTSWCAATDANRPRLDRRTCRLSCPTVI